MVRGAGILYPPNEQKCIFFNVIDSLQKRLLTNTLLYFDSKLLNNRSFYVSGGLISEPHYIKPLNENKKPYNRKKNFAYKIQTTYKKY